MDKYTSFIYKNKKLLVVLLMVVNIVALVGVTRIRLNTDFSMFSPTSSVYQDRLDELTDTFGELNQIIVLVEHEEFTSETILDLRSIQEHLELMDNVIFVQGVAPEFLKVNNIDVPIENVPVENVLVFYENFGEFSPLKIEEDGYFSSYTVFIDNDFGKEDIRDIEDMLSEYDYLSYVSGDTYNQLKISDYIIKILLLLPPLTILTILLVFRWQMGAIKPTLMSVLPAAIGSLWTFGFIGWLGNEVSILTAIVPKIGRAHV